MATFPFTNDPVSQVEMIYIAYFGRAGDPMGTNFWVNELTASGDTIVPGMTGVAAAFSQQPEAMAQYPLLANPQGASQTDIQVFINAIYQNLFGRSADVGGLAFWTSEVNAILATGDPLQVANGIGQMAVSIALGAQGNDQTVLENKVTVSDLLTQIFSEDGINSFPNPSNEFTFAHTDIAGVGAGQPSVIAAEIAATAFKGMLPIPNAGGVPLGATIDWTHVTFDYAQFSSPQVGALTIKNAPSIFTLDTQHYGANDVEIDPAGGHGNILALILGDSTDGDSLSLHNGGYETVDIVVQGSQGPHADTLQASGGDYLISGTGSLALGVFVGKTMTDYGVSLSTHGGVSVEKIDASNAPVLVMLGGVILEGQSTGVTVLAGDQEGNTLQGSLGGEFSILTLANQSTALTASAVGADNFTAGSTGGDTIFVEGGPDTVTLPNHSLPDIVDFGGIVRPFISVQAITDGMDVAYPGYWGATLPTPIALLFFPSNTGGTSADMTVTTGFQAGSSGDVLQFKVAAWNGASVAQTPFGTFAEIGDLVTLDGVLVVPTGNAQLSAVWTNTSSTLNTSDDVLRYAPSDASLQNAQQLAAQLHIASDAVTLPGVIPVGDDMHILVAYAAGNNVVNVADVDLVNTTSNAQSSTANLNVYASDMVHLVGVSLTSLTPDNIHFV